MKLSHFSPLVGFAAATACLLVGLCSCNTDEYDDDIGHGPLRGNVIIKVVNSDGENLLNPSTPDNIVGQSIKVTMPQVDYYYPINPIFTTYETDWSRVEWNSDLWKYYNIFDRVSEANLFTQPIILSKDKKLETSTDKLLYIGVIDDTYCWRMKIEWPDGSVDSIYSKTVSKVEGDYWYVNGRKSVPFTYNMTPDSPITIEK